MRSISPAIASRSVSSSSDPASSTSALANAALSAWLSAPRNRGWSSTMMNRWSAMRPHRIRNPSWGCASEASSLTDGKPSEI